MPCPYGRFPAWAVIGFVSHFLAVGCLLLAVGRVGLGSFRIIGWVEIGFVSYFWVGGWWAWGKLGSFRVFGWWGGGQWARLGLVSHFWGWPVAGIGFVSYFWLGGWCGWGKLGSFRAFGSMGGWRDSRLGLFRIFGASRRAGTVPVRGIGFVLHNTPRQVGGNPNLDPGSPGRNKAEIRNAKLET